MRASKAKISAAVGSMVSEEGVADGPGGNVGEVLAAEVEAFAGG